MLIHINRPKEAGLSSLEYIIALIIIMIAFVGWLNLTSTSIRNAGFVKKLADVNALASTKISQLDSQVNSLVAAIPSGQSQIGSLAPDAPINGYFEQLNQAGEI